MDNTNYVALSVQMVLQRQMDIIAHNMANVQTGAFKAEKPIFIEVLDDAGNIAYVEDYGVTRDMSPGPLSVTGGSLDVAVQGDGFLVVDVEGEKRYTRNGHLQLSAERELITSTGYRVLDVDGRKIEVPAGEDRLTISPDGSLSSGTGLLARIDLVAFTNPLALDRAADSLYVAVEDPEPATDAALIQGTLEESNVKPVIEITDMIEVLRAYQRNAQLAETEHQLTLSAIDTLIQA